MNERCQPEPYVLDRSCLGEVSTGPSNFGWILLLADAIVGVGTETARQGGTEVQPSVVQGSGVRNARPALYPATNGEPQHNDIRFEFCAVASSGIDGDSVWQR